MPFYPMNSPLTGGEEGAGLLSELKNCPKVVGAKQTRRALKEGRAVTVFLAADADPQLTEPIRTQCAELGVPMEEAATMKELGRACGITVSAAVAALVH